MNTSVLTHHKAATSLRGAAQAEKLTMNPARSLLWEDHRPPFTETFPDASDSTNDIRGYTKVKCHCSLKLREHYRSRTLAADQQFKFKLSGHNPESFFFPYCRTLEFWCNKVEIPWRAPAPTKVEILPHTPHDLLFTLVPSMEWRSLKRKDRKLLKVKKINLRFESDYKAKSMSWKA